MKWLAILEAALLRITLIIESFVIGYCKPFRVIEGSSVIVNGGVVDTGMSTVAELVLKGATVVFTG